MSEIKNQVEQIDPLVEQEVTKRLQVWRAAAIALHASSGFPTPPFSEKLIDFKRKQFTQEVIAEQKFNESLEMLEPLGGIDFTITWSDLIAGIINTIRSPFKK